MLFVRAFLCSRSLDIGGDGVFGAQWTFAARTTGEPLHGFGTKPGALLLGCWQEAPRREPLGATGRSKGGGIWPSRSAGNRPGELGGVSFAISSRITSSTSSM